MVEFDFYKFSTELSEDLSEISAIHKEFYTIAKRARNELEALYSVKKSMGFIVKNFPQKVYEYQIEIFELCIEKMQILAPSEDPEEFLNLFMEDFKYENYISDVLEEYSKVMDTKYALQEYREQQRMAQGRWQGGGFGLKGAIKGAAMASVLNAGNDILHNVADNKAKSRDEKQIRKQLEALYKDEKTKYAFVDGAYECLMSVFYNFYCLATVVGVWDDNILDKMEAEKYYDCYRSAIKTESKDNLNKMLINAISYYPFEEKYYKAYYQLCVEDMKESLGIGEFESTIENKSLWKKLEQKKQILKTRLGKFLEYVHMTELQDSFINEEIKQKMEWSVPSDIKKRLESSYIGVSEYKHLKRWYRFFTVSYNMNLPISSIYYGKFQKCILQAETREGEIDLADDFDIERDKNLALEEYILRIYNHFENERDKIFWNTYVKGISLDFKAKEKIIKRKMQLLQNKQLILIHNTAIMGEFSKGFVITEDSFVDLKNLYEIKLDNIQDCYLQYEELRIHYDGDKVINVKASEYITLEYLESIIKCFSSFRGSEVREDIEKERQQNEKDSKRERDIQEMMKNGAEKCLEKGLEYAYMGDVYNANVCYLAAERMNDDRIESMSNFGNALLFLKENGTVANEVKRGLNSMPTDIDEQYKDYVSKCLNFQNEEGNSILFALIERMEILSIRQLMQFDFNKQQTYQNATLLDWAEHYVSYNKSLKNREEAELCGKICEILQEVGIRREWNITLKTTYSKIRVQDFIKNAIKKEFPKDEMMITSGKVLENKMSDLYKKAQNNFGVKSQEPIYFIGHGSPFKNFKSGFAICYSGIYGKADSKEKFYIPWTKFLESDIVFGNGNIYFDGESVLNAHDDRIERMFRNIIIGINEYGKITKQDIDINVMETLETETKISKDSNNNDNTNVVEKYEKDVESIDECNVKNQETTMNELQTTEVIKNERRGQKKLEEKLFKCVQDNIKVIDTYTIVGKKLKETNPKQYQKAKINLGINDEEEVFMLADGTLFKSFKEGFAVCSSGIYLSTSSGRIYRSWEEMRTCKIEAGSGSNIKIDGIEIFTFANVDKCVKMFEDIKQILNGKEKGSQDKDSVIEQDEKRQVRFCSECGEKIQESAKFCQYCGHKINMPNKF